MNAETLLKTIDIRIWELFFGLINIICKLIEKDFDDVMDLILCKPQMAQWVESMIGTHYKQSS